eukprot:702143_1
MQSHVKHCKYRVLMVFDVVVTIVLPFKLRTNTIKIHTFDDKLLCAITSSYCVTKADWYPNMFLHILHRHIAQFWQQKGDRLVFIQVTAANKSSNADVPFVCVSYDQGWS